MKGKVGAVGFSLFWFYCITLALGDRVQRDIPSQGRCPIIRARPFINLRKLLGTWYAVKRLTLAEDPEAGPLLDCFSLSYSRPRETNPVRIGGKVHARARGSTQDFEVDIEASIPNIEEASVWDIKMDGEDFKKYILATDYCNYCLVYFCREKYEESTSRIQHVDGAVILSRDGTLHPITLNYLIYILRQIKPDLQRMHDVDQEDCD